MYRACLLVAVCLAGVAACDDRDVDDGGDRAGEGELLGDDLDGVDSTTLPADVFPCDQLAAWPYSLTSSTHPLRVHFRARDEEDMARTVLGHADDAWSTQVDTLGMPAPYTDALDDDAVACGPDARVDVFVFKGLEAAYVDVVAEIVDTDTDIELDDYAPFMVIDPFGVYGGTYLRPTVFHEFHHMTQAAIDWSDAVNVYEMSAMFVEGAVAGSDEWEFTLGDLVEHVDWSIDRDDGYETNFMYAHAVYLHYLRQAWFDGDIGFFVDMWRGMGGAPTYQDALDTLLAEHGADFISTVAPYARWLAYSGEPHDDGAHFDRGALWPEVVRQPVAGGTVTVSPMVLGSAYLDVDASCTVSLVSTLPDDVTVVVQQVPGNEANSDGDVLTLPATLPAGVTLVVTVLPVGNYEVLSRTDATVDVALRFE